ncbi:hypothetical protein Hanom_Chr16g01521981 [Helianthus anomalus]
MYYAFGDQKKKKRDNNHLTNSHPVQRTKISKTLILRSHKYTLITHCKYQKNNISAIDTVY